MSHKTPQFVVRPLANELNQIPKFGDPELLPKPDLVRPSVERMPFSPSGTLIPEGPRGLPEDFLFAANIQGLPWTRERYDAWSTETFRNTVMDWLRFVFRTEDALIGWDVDEKGTGRRMGHLRLRPEFRYLLIGLTKRTSPGESGRAEISLTFPQGQLDDVTVIRGVLDSNALPSLQMQLAAL